ncbi:MAG TPA: ATP-dependent sacrificial sulfur transferase LarE [Bacteroidetes bacterium]|nr:ATP-dependent sacrificial sulfur transferase LarE [Bacteroidota bacterium]
MAVRDRIKKLCTYFSDADNILVAFSGGVDSTFLLYVLNRFSDAKVSAVTIKTHYIPQWEVEEAINFCRSMNIDHDILNIPLDNSIVLNPPDRCYRCKSILFGHIKKYAGQKGFNIIADGSNADDISDYRPGMKALKELDIRSPLLEAGFTKEEIRKGLRSFKLEIWNKPAYACLLTRLPFNSKINLQELRLVEESERYMHRMGFPGARVRLHNNIVRLEISPVHFSRILKDTIRKEIIKEFKSRGIEFISLDLEGYRMGSMNQKK